MDTNQNIHVNTFTGGMNTDQSYDSIKENEYTLAVNLRATTNKYNNDELFANQKEGLLTPITTNQQILNTEYLYDGKLSNNETEKVKILGSNILKSLYSGNINIILYRSIQNYICVGKISGNTLTVLFYIINENATKNISAVLHTEQEDVCNLYIATGVDQLLSINISDENYIKQLHVKESLEINKDDIRQCSYFPRYKTQIVKKISGQLKTSQIQYTYRFYKKHGICSKLAPLTNKIQIIDDIRNKEIGNAENTQTSVGLQIKIVTDEKQLSYISKVFDHVQIYRLSYIKPGQNADVQLIFDGKYYDNLIINDDGIKSIQDLSIEEFSSLSGLTIIPSIIEQNQNYLFAANIKDETIISIDDSINVTAQVWNYNGDAGDILDNKYIDINTESNITKDSYAFTKSKYLGIDNDLGEIKLTVCKIPIFNTFGTETIKFYYLKPDFSGNIVLQREEIKDIDLLKNHQIDSSFDISGGYNNFIVSSLCRSLRRDEVYRYGIIFYDKYGNRTDVIFLGDIKTPSIKELPLISVEDIRYQSVYALALGLSFDFNIESVKTLSENEIVGYEIVRCEKSDGYTRNLQQVVISGVIQQTLPDGTKSPAYPTGFITSQPVKLNLLPYVQDTKDIKRQPAEHVKNLYQIFNPGIFIQRNDILSQIKNNICKIKPVNFLYTGIDDTSTIDYNIYNNENRVDDDTSESNKFNNKALIATNPYYSLTPLYTYMYYESQWESLNELLKVLNETNEKKPSYGEYLYIDPARIELCKSKKLDSCFLFDMLQCVNKIYTYNPILNMTVSTNVNNRFITNASLEDPIELPMDVSYDISNIVDIKDTTWDSGFSNYKYDGNTLKTATKKYKSYITNIGTHSYLNWVCSGKYDIPVGNNDKSSERQYGYDSANGNWKFAGEFTDSDTNRWVCSRGPIGPAGQCLMIEINGRDSCLFDKLISPIKLESNERILTNKINDIYPVGTFLCNITHNASRFSGIDSTQLKYDQYYGFGNYFNLEDNSGDINKNQTNIVFDGEIYIDMHELYGMLKAWDFNDDKNNLQSMQTVYYVPMESIINTRFDYGMNYRNTHNTNLTLESSQITGLQSQDRPLRQYNLIYSDNNTSNNIFNMSSDKDQINNYQNRIYYSNLKTNGEYIDNWQIFKAVNFIDADSKYGEITDLYTFKDTLLFWQEYSVGKLSVNERSLVKDENSNTIQLGQGDVLQRTDYISTKYGMRKYDMCKTETENGVFWFDYYNKCIATLNEGGAIDYTELKNVKSLINEYKDYLKIIPQLSYDQNHQELLFSPLIVNNNIYALVFNTKYNIATSLYTLNVNDCTFSTTLQLNKDIYTVNYNPVDRYTILQSFYKGSILPSDTKIQFVVNKQSSVTKVFDNQQIGLQKRTDTTQFFKNKELDITTDICKTKLNGQNIDLYNTDREGNIQYAIPRVNSNINEYGGRVRGKWMLETLTDYNPTEESAISHIITKFRTSYN